MSNNLRTVIAAVLSMLVLIVWQKYIEKKEAPELSTIQNNDIDSTQKSQQKNDYNIHPDNNKIHIKSRETIINEGKQKGSRILFDNNVVSGSINLIGAKIDDLILLKYKQNTKEHSENVVLLSPTETQEVYYAEFGWLSNDKNIELPNNKSIWSTNYEVLAPNNKITLTWKNNDGLQFLITLNIDENYMFTIEQQVLGKNTSSIRPYAALSRSIDYNSKSQMLIHEGGIGVFENKLNEITFEDLDEKKQYKFSNVSNGWFGFTDKYWLTAIIPENILLSSKFSKYNLNQSSRYQVDGIIKNFGVNDNINYSKLYFFAGAKELNLLDKYEKKYSIKLFDRAVDFGILYFITKPIFITLNFFHSLIGNFGIAIILLTIFIKVLLFPLAYKGFKGMNRLKELQPEMTRLKKICGDDRMKFQKSIVELYKKEKVNPMSGCFPILLQMPVFFALYKVLYVTLEMRHARFFGWINDLSAQDPTNIFTLFGLIPWQPPSFFHIGILPIIMAITLYFQQVLSPQPTDPMQAKVMKILPVIFLFMFASFPSGLVLYWSWSNILSITQQVLIKRMTE